jgi:hypothetical protein
LYLLLAEDAREKSGFFWIILVTLATICFLYALESNLDVIATSCPSWFSALTTGGFMTHIFSPYL